MPRVALGIAYDGSDWLGWQTQKGGGTVQDTLEGALARFLALPVNTFCAGRTDTGVHALGQVVHLDTTATRRMESWVRGLNALLPSSIAVQWACEVPETFHARYSATSRSYVYLVRNTRLRSPLMHGRAGWVYHPLDLLRMRQAMVHLLGRHDFSSFRSSQCQAASPVRDLLQADVRQFGDYFMFTFKANAFLHHMIRNLMGAIIYIGQAKQEPEWILDLLSQRDRKRSAPTFSAAGLYLAHAAYPAEFRLPDTPASAAVLSHLGIQMPSG